MREKGLRHGALLIFLSRNLRCVWEQLEGWDGGVLKRLQPHIRTTTPPSVQYRASDHFRQQLRPHIHEQGYQGVCVVSSPQACSSGESHTKSMSRVWPGYQGNQKALSQTALFSCRHLNSMTLTRTKGAAFGCRRFRETTAQHKRSPEPTLSLSFMSNGVPTFAGLWS